MINILLLIMVTLSYTSVLGQTQETASNNTIDFVNSSFIRDALDSVHNETIPYYVKLSEKEINEALKDLPGWTVLDGKLHKTFNFVDFPTLFEFMYKVADVSQKLNHHPNMTSTWNSLTLDYDTWSLGHVISNLDVKAAQNLEKTYQNGNYKETES
ncbi:MAG TPA: 4a-hydroxytetrahydrobiopterin dehydratase [Nitrososphaeraceae archaeon]|nr:4a-hydroxytetrahydrobiopterin dehydratase [Nitrososphaeraceae archaeon]